jgi:hypothetical protein
MPRGGVAVLGSDGLKRLCERGEDAFRLPLSFVSCAPLLPRLEAYINRFNNSQAETDNTRPYVLPTTTIVLLCKSTRRENRYCLLLC